MSGGKRLWACHFLDCCYECITSDWGGLRGIVLYSCSVASGLRVRLPARPLERCYVSKEGREGDDARPYPPRRCSEYPALNLCLDACSLAIV